MVENYRQSYYRLLIETHTMPFDCQKLRWPWLTLSGHFSFLGLTARKRQQSLSAIYLSLSLTLPAVILLCCRILLSVVMCFVCNFYADDPPCSAYRYLKCLIPTAIKYQLFSDSYKHFTDTLRGHHYPMTFLCRYRTINDFRYFVLHLINMCTFKC